MPMPSKAEQKAVLFDASVAAISKVTLNIGGFFCGYEALTITVDEEHIHFDVEHFLIGEWRTDYRNVVLELFP